MPTKATLTTRTAKGSPLTTAEMDTNLENLRDASVAIASDDSSTIDLQLGNTLTVAGSGTVATAVSGQTLTVTGSGISASSTDTLTNKTIDANGTGNSITNLEVADLASGVLDTDLTSVSGSDDTLASAKAIKTYADTKAALTGSTNNTVVTVTGANAAQGEANLTFDGTTLGIANTSTSDSMLITTTEDSATAGPVLTMKRNSGSPADADYLGQLKFKGENDADQEVVYAKMTAKISDASDSSEDGLLEFSNIKAGAQTITARLTSTDLKLLNSTNLVLEDTHTYTSGFDDAYPGDAITIKDTSNNNTIVLDSYNQKSPATAAQFFSIYYDTTGAYTYPSGAASGDISNYIGYNFDDQQCEFTASGGDLQIKAQNHNDGGGADSYGEKKILLDSPIGKYKESVNTLTDDSTSDIHIDCRTQGPVSKFELYDAKEFVFSNLDEGRSHTLIITQTASNTATFVGSDSSAVKFPGGAPTITTGAGKIDVITVFFDGTNYLGNIAQDFS